MSTVPKGTCRVCRRRITVAYGRVLLHGAVGEMRVFERGGWRLPRCPGSFLAALRRGRKRKITIPGPYSATGL